MKILLRLGSLIIIFSALAFSQQPDFIVVSVSGPSIAQPGQTFNVTVQARNQGSNPTQPGSYVVLRMILSPDQQINLADIYYQDFNIPINDWNGGVTLGHLYSYTIPSNFSGTYYWGAYVDAPMYWNESSDNNNALNGNTVFIQTVNPTVSVSPSSGPQGTLFQEPGSLFTPNNNATLHFRKPDGIEYPTILVNTDGQGNYSHSYQSSIANPTGLYQYWAIDNATGLQSNTVNFSITALMRTLTVASSNPTNGVFITVAPTDNNGNGNGSTQFSRTYNNNASVSLTAPSTVLGNNFQNWERDGNHYSSNQSVAVTMDGNHTMVAVYVTPVVARTLTVASSNPNNSVSITMSPNDNNGNSTGITQFIRIYNNNTSVTLTAPPTASGNNFQKWQRDGSDFLFNTSATLTMDANHTMTAVYVAPPPVIRTLTVSSSNPNSGVSVSVSPPDNNGQTSGTTSFARQYSNNTSVSLTAPLMAGGNNFLQWQKDGSNYSTNRSIQLTMDADHLITAIYQTPPEIHLTSPISGESWEVGSVHQITWTHVNVNSVKIELSRDAGASWIIITASAPASDLSHSWTVEGPGSYQSKVRISDASNSNLNDINQGFFSIIEYVLKNASGEPFQLSKDAYQFANSVDNMWPYSHGINCFGEDVIWCWDRFRCEEVFPSWNLFSSVFGFNQTYIIQNGNMIKKPSAVNRWNSINDCWRGSCFGFGISSFLFFDNKLNISSSFSGYTSIYTVPIQDNSRTLVNTYFLYQFGANQQKHRKENWNRTPVQTLNDIKQMILSNNRDNRVLSFWDQNSSGGHTVNPYKVERDPSNSSLEYVYIYDNNHPNDLTKKIKVRTDLNTWAYDDLGWSGNKAFLLEEPVSTYLTTPILNQNIFAKDITTPLKTTVTRYIQFYASIGTSISITDSSGDYTIGYGDSLTFSNFPDGIPIVPTTGGFHPPIGYYLPEAKYSIHMQSSNDSTLSFSVFRDSIIYTYSRTDADSSQTDYFEFDNSLTIRNHDNLSKNVKLDAIVIGDNAERIFGLSNAPVSQNDSIKVDVEDKTNLKIVNFGTDKAYDLKLQLVSANGDSIFEHRNIPLPSNSMHQVIPQWDSLSDKAVKILIDSGNTGSVNDSIFANNRFFKFSLSQRWNIISLPLDVDDPRVSFLYPTTISNAFAYNPGIGYVQYDSLKARSGYWLILPADQIVTMYGIPVTSDTINVLQGWNLIGSISEPLQTSMITSNTPGMITSNFFGYHSAYFTTTILEPGKGYWVNVNQAGSLILSSNPTASMASRIRIVPTSELPPPPPESGELHSKEIPKEFALEQNYPNPFNPLTVIRYRLPVLSHVRLTVYNVLGQKMTTLIDEMRNAGYESVEWNASEVTSGVYFYRLDATSVVDHTYSFIQVRKMVLLK